MLCWSALLTMPVDRTPAFLNGDPSASTRSPAVGRVVFVLSYIGSGVHFAQRRAGIASTARSCAGSTTRLRAYTFVPLTVITHTSSELSSRCAFKNTSPDETTKKPKPRWLPYTVNSPDL